MVENSSSTRPGGLHWIWALILSVVPVVCASIVGQLATLPNLRPWYESLVKPSFSPPNWIFGPVWTTLFVLMAFAVWRILRRPASEQGRSLALILFYGQLVLNAAWPWMFFAAQKPILGLINIVPQAGLVIATALAFNRLDRIAGACLVPLAIWVSFASVLNAAIVYLN